MGECDHRRRAERRGSERLNGRLYSLSLPVLRHAIWVHRVSDADHADGARRSVGAASEPRRAHSACPWRFRDRAAGRERLGQRDRGRREQTMSALVVLVSQAAVRATPPPCVYEGQDIPNSTFALVVLQVTDISPVRVWMGKVGAQALPRRWQVIPPAVATVLATDFGVLATDSVDAALEQIWTA